MQLVAYIRHRIGGADWYLTSVEEPEFDEPISSGLTWEAGDELVEFCVRDTFALEDDDTLIIRRD